jgi:hypothetical protein
MRKKVTALRIVGVAFLLLFIWVLWSLTQDSGGDYPPMPDAENEAFFRTYLPYGLKPGYSFKVSEAWPGDWTHVCEVPIGKPEDYKKNIAQYFKKNESDIKIIKNRNNELSGDAYRAYIFYYDDNKIDYLQLRASSFPRPIEIRNKTICVDKKSAFIVKDHKILHTKVPDIPGQFYPYILQSIPAKE